MLLRLLSNQRLIMILSFLASLVLAFSLFSRAAHGAAVDPTAPDASPGSMMPDVPAAGPAIVPPSTATPLPPPAAEIPDPEQDPGGFINSLRAFWANGGKVPTVLAALIGLIAVLKRRVLWLGIGWRATAVSLVGVLVATLLDTWLSTGAAGNIWTWLFGGVFAVVSFIVNPRSDPRAKISDDPDEGGQGKIR